MLRRMRRTPWIACVAWASVLAISCGKELARIPMKDEGTRDRTFQVQSGKTLSFWTYFDADDDGTWQPTYEIDLLQDGAVKAHASCNPYDVSIKTNSREIHLGGKRGVHWDAKMRCELVPPFSGPAMARVTLKSPTHPASLKIADATLMIKE